MMMMMRRRRRRKKRKRRKMMRRIRMMMTMMMLVVWSLLYDAGGCTEVALILYILRSLMGPDARRGLL